MRTYYNMREYSMANLGVDPLERLKNLLILLTKNLLVSYQVAVLVITTVFLLVVGLLYFLVNTLILGI